MNKLFKSRVVPAIFFALGTVVPLILISVFAWQHFAVRIFSYVYCIAFHTIVFYEFLKATRLKIYYYMPLVIISMIIPLLPIDIMQEMVNPYSMRPEIFTNFDNHNISYFLRLIVSDWISVLIILGISFSCWLIELITTVNIKRIDRLTRFVLCFCVLYILSLACKLIQFSALVSWPLWVMAIIIPSLGDIGGFFGGKYFGKKFINKPFAPIISPKKTWEGFIASMIIGIIATLCFAFGFNLIPELHLFNQKYYIPVILALLIPLFGIGGDLFFSYIKRINCIKDYSKILGDHGGFLDRFDSVTFASFIIFFIMIFV